jgi:hypothetical protein
MSVMGVLDRTVTGRQDRRVRREEVKFAFSIIVAMGGWESRSRKSPSAVDVTCGDCCSAEANSILAEEIPSQTYGVNKPSTRQGTCMS